MSIPSLNIDWFTSFLQLRIAKHVKFAEECVMCSEQHVLTPQNVYKLAKHWLIMTSLSKKENPLSENTLAHFK